MWLHLCSNFNSKHVNMHTLSLLGLCVCVSHIQVHACSAQLVHMFAAFVCTHSVLRGDRLLHPQLRKMAQKHAHTRRLTRPLPAEFKQ